MLAAEKDVKNSLAFIHLIQVYSANSLGITQFSTIQVEQIIKTHAAIPWFVS